MSILQDVGGIYVNTSHIQERLEERVSSLVTPIDLEKQIKEVISLLKDKKQRGYLTARREWTVSARDFVAVGEGLNWRTILPLGRGGKDSPYREDWRI